MKKTLLSVYIATVFVVSEVKSQVLIDTVSIVSIEKINTALSFNNTKLMAGNNIYDRYLVYYNADTIFLNVYQSGIWTRKIAYTGSNIQSATLSFSKDTIWVCWKEIPYIKARYTSDKGNSWSVVLPVSPAGNQAAPSIYTSSNGKIHFVWFTNSQTDTTVYHNVYSNGAFLPFPNSLSNTNAQGSWPSVIAIGDTVLCAWKERPPPSKVWFASSFNGGASWNPPSLTTTLLSISKDPNLAYAYDSTTNTHYVYLAFDSQNKIWTLPNIISNANKLSQFANLECNNNGFVGVSYEHRTVTSLYDDTKKDVGFVFSTAWANSGSFGNDSLAYTYNPFGSVFTSFNKIDKNNFYLVWLTKDTVLNKMKVFERHVYFNNFGTLNLTTIMEGFYDASLNNMRLNDTLTIYLRNFSSPYAIVDSSTAVIDANTFTGLFQIKNAPTGTYYIQTGHRNTMETWTAAAMSYIQGASVSYDFTTSSSQAFGKNMNLVDASPVRFGIYSGDVNHDGFVNLNDIILTFNNSFNFINGYVNTDLTGDNITNLNDILIAYNNSNGFVSKITP